MTASAESVYVRLAKKSAESEANGDPTNQSCTVFRMVRDAIKNQIPADPINKRYALSGDLSNIFRIKKGRMRICWIASSEKREAIILYISETMRKDGDKNDPYEIFTRLVASGQFDQIFDRLGVKRPPRNRIPQ